MDSFCPGSQRCPHCKSTGNCVRHASYERGLVSYKNGRVVFHRLVILRVICSSCHHTHAILPDAIIPYGSYSLSFILQLMKEYYAGLIPVEQLCEQFLISTSTFYRLKHTFCSHRLLWLGITRASAQKESDFLLFLKGSLCLSEFLSGFYNLTAFSFLQQKYKTPRCRLPSG